VDADDLDLGGVVSGFDTPYATRCARERDGWDIRINGRYAGRIESETRPTAEQITAALEEED
jgi:hypothetical protein